MKRTVRPSRPAALGITSVEELEQECSFSAACRPAAGGHPTREVSSSGKLSRFPKGRLRSGVLLRLTRARASHLDGIASWQEEDCASEWVPG